MTQPPVHYINNAMRGAPVLSGTRGSLIALLEAFLVTGFGQVTANSVTVAGGVATASLQPGEGFALHANVLVAGATPAALNGVARVIEATLEWQAGQPSVTLASLDDVLAADAAARTYAGNLGLA